MAIPVAVLFAKSAIVDQYDLSSVRNILTGSSTLSKDIENEIKQRLGLSDFRQGMVYSDFKLCNNLL